MTLKSSGKTGEQDGQGKSEEEALAVGVTCKQSRRERVRKGESWHRVAGPTRRESFLLQEMQVQCPLKPRWAEALAATNDTADIQ